MKNRSRQQQQQQQQESTRSGVNWCEPPGSLYCEWLPSMLDTAAVVVVAAASSRMAVAEVAWLLAAGPWHQVAAVSTSRPLPFPPTGATGSRLHFFFFSCIISLSLFLHSQLFKKLSRVLVGHAGEFTLEKFFSSSSSHSRSSPAGYSFFLYSCLYRLVILWRPQVS